MSVLQSTAPIFFSLKVHSENPNSPIIFTTPKKPRQIPRPYLSYTASSAHPNSEQSPNSKPNPTPRKRGRPPKPKEPPPPETSTSSGFSNNFPSTIPRKPRRGRRSEAVAVEDYIRGRLEQVFASIREQDADVLEGKREVLKQRVQEAEEEPEMEMEEEKVHVVEEENPNWPVDADVGWGVRASEYFEKHPIKNVVVDGVEIDWEIADSPPSALSLTFWSIGEIADLHPSMLVSLRRSSTYFLWDKTILSSSRITSIPRNYLSCPRSFTSNSLFNLTFS